MTIRLTRLTDLNPLNTSVHIASVWVVKHITDVTWQYHHLLLHSGLLELLAPRPLRASSRPQDWCPAADTHTNQASSVSLTQFYPWSFLDDLLVSLYATVSLEQIHRIAELVPKHLHLDVSGSTTNIHDHITRYYVRVLSLIYQPDLGFSTNFSISMTSSLNDLRASLRADSSSSWNSASERMIRIWLLTEFT